MLASLIFNRFDLNYSSVPKISALSGTFSFRFFAIEVAALIIDAGDSGGEMGLMRLDILVI